VRISESKSTTDHDEIGLRVEARGGLERGGDGGTKATLFEAGQPGRCVRQAIRFIARVSPGVVGSAEAIAFLLLIMIVWIGLGPIVGFSDAWLLVPSAVASIVALLLVLLLQYSQNRDTRALQLKLDEVIRSVSDARTHLVRLEGRSDEELEQIEAEFEQLRKEQDVA
jgi:low affinity Fe/Cu permease